MQKECVEDRHTRQAVYMHVFDVGLLLLTEEVRRRGQARHDSYVLNRPILSSSIANYVLISDQGTEA